MRHDIHEEYDFVVINNEMLEEKKATLLKELEDFVFVNYKRQAFIEWDYRIAANEDRWSQSVVSTLLIYNDYYLGWLPDNFGNSLNGK